MDKQTIINQVLILSSLISAKAGDKKLSYNDLSEQPIDDLKKILFSLRETHNEISKAREAEYKAKMAGMKNPLRDAALAAYKSFADKDKAPINLEIIDERSIGEFYNSIRFETINGLPHMTRQAPINSPSVHGIITSQIANSPYDLSSMSENEIHPFLTKLFYDFFDLISKFNDGTCNIVIKSMLHKIEVLRNNREMHIEKNNQPSFVISILPKGETTEIYLDFSIPDGYLDNRHNRDKFVLNNSTKELTFKDKKIKHSSLDLYAKNLFG